MSQNRRPRQNRHLIILTLTLTQQKAANIFIPLHIMQVLIKLILIFAHQQETLNVEAVNHWCHF